MSERFRQILEEASERVRGWPDWKKSEALKLSEQSLASRLDATAQVKAENLNGTDSAAK